MIVKIDREALLLAGKEVDIAVNTEKKHSIICSYLTKRMRKESQNIVR